MKVVNKSGKGEGVGPPGVLWCCGVVSLVLFACVYRYRVLKALLTSNWLPRKMDELRGLQKRKFFFPHLFLRNSNSNKMSNKSDSNSNKAQKTNDEGDAASGSTAPPTLAKALVKEAGILRNLVKMTSMPQTFLLLLLQLHGGRLVHGQLRDGGHHAPRHVKLEGHGRQGDIRRLEGVGAHRE